MKDAETLTRAAEAAGAARLNHIKRSDVPLEFIPTDEEEAYAIQGAVVDWLCANGLGPQAGAIRGDARAASAPAARHGYLSFQVLAR